MTLPCAPSPASSVSVRTRPLPPPNPTTTQSREPSRATSARWAPKIHDFSFRSWPQTYRRRAFWPDHELDHGVEQRLGLGGPGQVLLPHLGLGALVEHDQHAPLQRGAGGGAHGGEQDRGIDAHAARHPDERAALPCVLVPAREDVVGGDHAAQVGLDQLRVPLARDRQREHDRAVLDRRALADRAVDLVEPRRVLQLEQALGHRVQVAAVDRRERAEVEFAEVGELPAGAALEGRQLERRRLSQWSPPSGARSGGSSRPRTPSAAP